MTNGQEFKAETFVHIITSNCVIIVIIIIIIIISYHREHIHMVCEIIISQQRWIIGYKSVMYTHTSSHSRILTLNLSISHCLSFDRSFGISFFFLLCALFVLLYRICSSYIPFLLSFLCHSLSLVYKNLYMITRVEFVSCWVRMCVYVFCVWVNAIQCMYMYAPTWKFIWFMRIRCFNFSFIWLGRKNVFITWFSLDLSLFAIYFIIPKYFQSIFCSKVFFLSFLVSNIILYVCVQLEGKWQLIQFIDFWATLDCAVDICCSYRICRKFSRPNGQNIGLSL